MLTSKPWLDPTQILVQVKLNKAFLSKVPIKDASGSITMLLAAYVSFLQDNKISPPLMLTLLQMMSHCPNLLLLCLLSEPDSSFKASVTTTGESVISIATSKSHAAIISTPEVIEFISPSAADNAVNQSAIATSTKSVSTMISPPISHHDTFVVSPSMESTRSLPITDTPIAQVPPAVQRESSGIAGLVLGLNKFALLIYLQEEEEDPVGFTSETNSMDLMTPSGKRTLRERPVKPSEKAREMHFRFTGSGRGNHGQRGLIVFGSLYYLFTFVIAC
ncbi:unnamed protein product [Brassica rapa subsp. trilocularis]